MPRSKFATKAYGPTKPKICQDQILPPGVLAPGPSTHLTAHFLLVVSDTGGLADPVSGICNLTRSANPDQYTGTATLGEYRVELRLTAVGPAFAPLVDYWITKGGTFVTVGQTSAQEPRTIDPYDTGILLVGQRTQYGQQMIRIVARD